jgi:P-type Cu+ transporter
MTKLALETRTLKLEGMTCSACVNTIERALNNLDGVSATVNYASETAHILAPAEISTKKLIETVKGAGYSAQLLGDSNQFALHSKRSAVALIFALLFSVPAIAISMTMAWHEQIDARILQTLEDLRILPPLYSPTAWLVIALSAPVVLLVAWPIHRAALRNLLHPTMDNLISLGSLTAFGWSIYANATGNGDVYTEVAAGVATFVILGRFLETRAKRRASSALSALLALNVKEVSVVRGGLTVLIPVENLEIGDEFVVAPGDRVATDGVVVSGNSSVDNSLITGESLPLTVGPGDRVIGSSINTNGRLIVRATRVGRDTEYARITSMVMEAQSTKAPIARLADQISAVFVPIVFVISLATFGVLWYNGYSISESIARAIAVIVIACPCALGLATPVALLVASGRGAQRGIIIRNPRVLEVARKVDTIVLDKTGTLTTGAMKVHEITIATDAGAVLGASFEPLLREATILSTALSIEEQNNHPIALSIREFISSQGIKSTSVSEFQITPGSGAAGRVNLGTHSPVVLIGSPAAVAHSTTTFHPLIAAAVQRGHDAGLSVSVLAWDGVALAVFAVGDELKSDAAETIEKLKSAGITPWLLTGDSEDAGQSIAKQVGIESDHVFSGALPQGKLTKIRELQSQSHTVVMVGDGINDAAALVGADISIAMGTGTDVAVSSADITLMRTDLGAVLDALKLSKRTLRTIRVNLGWAFAYNVVGIPIAALGLLSPMYAAGAMALSSLFVVTNSLRIKVPRSK